MSDYPLPQFELLFGTAAALVQNTTKAVLNKAWRGFSELERANSNPVL
jgi:hypothetical protein